MRVIPIAATQINWNDLLRLGKDVVGRSPSRSLDDARMKPGDIFSSIVALLELEREISDPRTAVTNAIAPLHHLSCSFLVEISNEETVWLHGIQGLTLTFFDGEKKIGKPQVDLLLVTGTLAQWQYVLPQYCTRYTDFTQIQLFNAVYNWFKRLSLKELFSSYSEVDLRNGSFALERD